MATRACDERICDVRLRLGSKDLERTQDVAVFISSPTSHRRARKRAAQARAKASRDQERLLAVGLQRADSAPVSPASACALSPTSAKKLPGKFAPSLRSLMARGGLAAKFLAAQPLAEEEAKDCTESGSEEKDETAENGVEEDESEEEDTLTESSSDSSGCSDDGVMAPESPSEQLRLGIYRRATEQTLVANLKHLASKQRLRYGSDSGGAADQHHIGEGDRQRGGSCQDGLDPGVQRLRVRDEAVKFTTLYSDTVGIFQTHMTLKPPQQRRHTITLAQLEAYSSVPESPTRTNRVWTI
eukprot:TRINITY_DN16976_c0_g1_i1.p1 TRINITY_DN16976_c0_g1~~TRINITY_DN16976_c0_g1_i1.p1  ORF type:complete len:299 (-),score=76.90 TRINITY_DN16976_c0_g1_i1:365-1261(-)